MATKTSLDEHRFLIEAENEIAENGVTNRKCPRCGNEIIIENNGSGYAVRCKSKDCIKAEFRGI